MAVPDMIKELTTKIRNATLGGEITKSIADGIDFISGFVTDNQNRQDQVEEQFQQVIDETTGKDVVSAPEIIAARNGEDNLKARLDKENQEVTAHLAQKANDDVVRKRHTPITINDFDGETLGIIQDGSGGAPIEILSIPRDGSVTPEKTIFFYLENLVNPNAITENHSINEVDGSLLESQDHNVTDFLEVEEGKMYYYQTLSSRRAAFYTKDKETVQTFTSENPLSNPFTIPAGVGYVRFTQNKSDHLDGTSMVSPNPITEFIPYGYKIKDEFINNPLEEYLIEKGQPFTGGNVNVE